VHPRTYAGEHRARFLDDLRPWESWTRSGAAAVDAMELPRFRGEVTARLR